MINHRQHVKLICCKKRIMAFVVFYKDLEHVKLICCKKRIMAFVAFYKDLPKGMRVDIASFTAF